MDRGGLNMAATITPQAAITAYQEAYQKLGEAQIHEDNAQEQYDAARNAKAIADGNAADAVNAYNAAIDAAVAALQAAKVGVPVPVPAAA
jgi:hypothetical protein